MKKKQRDDVMGEDQSSLPINDGEPVFTLERYRNAAKRFLLQCLVDARVVSQRRHIFTNCKRGVPTNRRRPSTSALHVGSNGGSTDGGVY